MRPIYAGLAGLALVTGSLVAGPAAAQPAPAEPQACAASPADGATLTCSCDIASPDGSVWGSGPYTNDSDICTAAVHAGVLVATEDKGAVSYAGPVTVTGSPGCSSYEATTANGVSTREYGAWSGSIFFPATQNAICPSDKAPGSDESPK